MKRLLLVTALALMCGCASEFASDPTRPRPTRAVQNPYDRSSSNNDVMTYPTGAVPLLTVDFASNKDEKPRVHSVVDDLRSLQGAPAARPTARGATTRPAENASATQPATGIVIERTALVSSQQVRVVAQRRADDRFAIAGDADGNVHLTVTSPSGIGAVTLERTGESWPAVLHVSLQRGAGQPFTRLEGFSAAEVTETGRRVELKVTKGEGTATVAIPGFVRSPRVVVDWVDAYR